jgi:hypothetical protein
MMNKSFFPHKNNNKRLMNCQQNESSANSTLNYHWPKALVSPFMIERNKVKSALNNVDLPILKVILDEEIVNI